MKIHDRVCIQCGSILEQSRTRADVCNHCTQLARRAERDKQQLAVLNQYYDSVEFAGVSQHGKSQWKVKHHCGTESVMLFANIKKGLDLGKVPCKGCR